MSTPTLCTGLYIADFNNHPFFPANTTPRTTLKLYSPWRILFNKSPSSYRFILQPHEPLYKTHRFYSYFAPSFSFFPYPTSAFSVLHLLSVRLSPPLFSISPARCNKGNYPTTTFSLSF